jgi:predicted ATPase
VPDQGETVTDALPGDTGIRTPDQRLRVFVSSTLAELADERRAVSRAISALRLTPVMFELGARPHPPRELYRAYLAQSDIFIGLYWQSYGQVAPGMDVSGLEDEFDLSRQLPRLLYVKVPAADREARLADLLSRMKQETSYQRFLTAAELGRLVRDDLATLLSERFAAANRATAVTARSRSRDRLHPLPSPATPLVGREHAIDEVAGLVLRHDVRLVTLTGPGGIGKTRLAIAVGERLREHFSSGVVFVPLATVTRSELLVASIGPAAGAELSGRNVPLQALIDHFGDDEWLVILDNLEHLVDAARDLDELLANCPGLAIVTTSLTVLRLRAERVYQVPALPLPANPAVPVDELTTSPAVALFVERAQAVRNDFALTAENAQAVAEICRRLEGLPLAIELAAARTRLLDPETLLDRLARSLDALGAGTVDMPVRQRTLRATVEWSVSLLDAAERSLLETVAVFVDGWTIEAAAAVAGLDEDRILELTEVLAGHSLIYLETGDLGPRSRMLETIREFVAERLAVRPDIAEIQRRHADHYRALAEQSDRPLLDGGQNQWPMRLQVERGNLAVAVRWYMDHDRTPLPNLFRVMAPWAMRPFLGLPPDILSEARSLLDELVLGADSLDAHPRAELLWAAAVVALEVGDDDATGTVVERLEPLLPAIDDPYLEAVSRLVLSWWSAITDDFDRGVREASASLALLRRLDERLWIPVALLTLGSLETAVGHYDDAALHLIEMRDRAERVGNSWLTISSRVQLGKLALARARFDDARAVLAEALDLSIAAQHAPSLAVCLAAFADLAFAEGDMERAALLAGATDGLRRRAGLRVWGSERLELERNAQIRRALGADHFDELFAAGSRLNQQDAMTAVRDRRGQGARAS